jgi:DNA-binding CsgD family transcriptional regulator
MRRGDLDALTDREREVLKLLRRDFTNEQIAQHLGISLDGAKYHVSEILSKLGVSAREEAAGWQPPPERRSSHWKLGWIGGAGALAITAAMALVLAVPGDRRSIELESDVFARDSEPTTTKPRSVATSATPAPVEPPRPPIPAPGAPVSGALVGESGPAPESGSEPASEASVEPTAPAPAEPTPPTGPFETPASPGSIPAPRMSLDMETAGSSYDDVANTMTVGPINNCVTSVSGNNAAHNHTAHLVVQNVEDLVGWQARFSYDGGKMWPLGVYYAPFTDTVTGQNVSFLNLPRGPAGHRGITSGHNIPAPAPGPQTALVGAVYDGGARNAAVSPDTPPKVPPDDASYGAPSGGVLAAITLRVEAGQAGQAPLSMDLDDGDPNTPGSSLILFTETGVGQDTIYLGEDALGDGFHGEGASCPAVGTAGPSTYAGALSSILRPLTSNPPNAVKTILRMDRTIRSRLMGA